MNNLTIRELMVKLIAHLSISDDDQAKAILAILKKRTGEEFSNVDMWFGWYAKSQADEEDKRVVSNGYDLFKRKINIT